MPCNLCSMYKDKQHRVSSIHYSGKEDLIYIKCACKHVETVAEWWGLAALRVDGVLRNWHIEPDLLKRIQALIPFIERGIKSS